jgi:hypothetical protein
VAAEAAIDVEWLAEAAEAAGTVEAAEMTLSDGESHGNEPVGEDTVEKGLAASLFVTLLSAPAPLMAAS